ncbi:CPBP family glutamic-type intramembrane protease [Actinomadura macra]|uniref:CPBP family glutamic-type intramembrane protease n=1 Tax=Actinomadura macra TaxID=46164 RepID=UPI000A6C3AE2|nr:CPBP family glutamic-type intramembrane protease [Actinomadura macra]
MTKSSLWRGVAALVVLFGPHSAASLNTAAGMVGADTDWPAFAVNPSAASLTATGIWLLLRNCRSAHGRAARSAALGAAGLALAGAVLLPFLDQAADTIATLLLTGAGAWLCAQIAADAGAPLWRGRLSCEIFRRWNMDAVAACAVVFAGHTATMLLDDWITQLGPAVADQAAQADATGLHNPIWFAAQALAAGIREEIPLLALPAALMAAARRPPWQILTVVCLLRAIPHAYLGTPALTTVVFAGVAWWMYRATRRIGPIIVGHTLFNAIALFNSPAAYVLLLAGPAVAALLLAGAPNAAPAWLRKRPRDKPARSDHPAKGPVL